MEQVGILEPEYTMLEDGTKEWWKGDFRHRDYGPAVVRPNGEVEWWHEGEEYDKDDYESFCPIVRYNLDGTKEFLLEGLRHRDGGPAVVRLDGRTEWFCHGMRHRDGGPAVTNPNGLTDTTAEEEWYKYDKYHREGGPAVTTQDGTHEWYLDGVNYTEESYNVRLKRLREIRFHYFHKWYDTLDDLSRAVGVRRMAENYDEIKDILEHEN